MPSPSLTEKWAERFCDVARVHVEADHVEPFADPRTGARGHKFVLMDEGDDQGGAMLVVRVELKQYPAG